MTTTHLLDDLKTHDMKNAFLTSLDIKWNAYHHNEGIVNYGVPPNARIEIVFPVCNKKVNLHLNEINTFNINPLFDLIELDIDKYVSFFHVYINPKNLFPDDYIECKNIDISFEEYEIDEDLLVELFLNDL